MNNTEAIELVDDRMCWGRGTWSAHHMPERDEYWEAGEMAIEALKKQTPKVVRTEYDSRHTFFLHFCPVCGELAREFKYCSECGQALSYKEDCP